MCKTIWQLNQSIPNPEQKIRFLQLGTDINERKLESPDPEVQMRERMRLGYDEKMAEIMEREVLKKGKRALWYSGLHHAFTKYRQPMYFFRVQMGEDMRGGNFLYEKFPDRIYMIALHFPAPSRLAILAEATHSDWTFYYPFGGVVDAVEERWEKPFAFDSATSPFGKLEDNHSYYSLDRWGPLALKEFCDGYTVLSSFQRAEPVTRINQWVASEADLEETKERMTPKTAARIHDAHDLLQMLDEDRLSLVQALHKIRR